MNKAEKQPDIENELEGIRNALKAFTEALEMCRKHYDRAGQAIAKKDVTRLVQEALPIIMTGDVIAKNMDQFISQTAEAIEQLRLYNKLRLAEISGDQGGTIQ